jgi:PAS domain S-box-containing protein
MATAPPLSLSLEVALILLAAAIAAVWVRSIYVRRTRELRESEERFRHLFDNAIDGVYENPPEGGFRRVNPAMARILGYATPAEALKIRPEETAAIYVSPTRREEFFATLGASDYVADFDSEIRRPDGTTVWIKENVRAIRDADGRLLYLQGFVSDITARKEAEAALRASEERLSVTLRAMSESVITTDPAGMIQYMNDAAGVLTGWSPAEAMGCALTAVCPLQSSRAEAPILPPVAQALEAGRPVDLPAHTVLQSHKGNARRVEGRCAPMHDHSGRAIGAVLVLRDITERARLEAELLRASKLESVGVLAGGIAHDFNNLLTVVLGNLAIALTDPTVRASAGRWLRDAESGAHRARDLTQQLLTFAKGGEPLRTTVMLPEVVREAAEFALHGSTVRCDFDVAADLAPADVDKGQIGQVVQNLVINAVQAMTGGGIIRITLRNARIPAGGTADLPGGAYVRIDITDTGAGIAPEHLPRIFEPFFTTKETGTGLGLATVYSVIQKHRGRVTVESEFGRGTTFRCWLPAAPGVSAAIRSTTPPFEQVRGRVLFMDDEEPIRIMTKALLDRLGLDTMVVSDGEEAVRHYCKARSSGRPFDLVIMDLTVPGAMGGAEAMGEILKLDPQARGIVSSGYSSDPVMANYRAHGFRAMVPKPYRIGDFARTIREVLNNGGS